jgi:site-specific DNA recombinase
MRRSNHDPRLHATAAPRLLLAAKNARKVVRRPRTTPRAYALRGVLFCGICHRRMQGSWNNSRPYYRCTFPAEYALANQIQDPRAVYLREAEILPELDTWLTKALDPRHLPATLDALAAGQLTEPSPEETGLREEIAACERQLAQYRAALDGGGDPAVVGGWITETQARKLTAEARLRTHNATTGPAPGHMSKEEIAALADTITGLMAVPHHAEPADKTDIYTALGLRLTYNPGPRTVTARAEIGQTCTKGSCPRGERTQKPMRARR